MNFKPQNGRLVVKPEPKDKVTESGIVIPDSVKEEKPVIGTVVVSGETGLSVGARVLFSRYSFDEFTHEDEVYYVVSSSSILGIYGE